MSTAQLRHMKLWFAGESPNWELAAYELRQLKASLIEAASLYPGVPITSITTMATPIQSVADAIAAKNNGKFEDLRRTDGWMQRLPSADRTGLHCHAGADGVSLQ